MFPISHPLIRGVSIIGLIFNVGNGGRGKGRQGYGGQGGGHTGGQIGGQGGHGYGGQGGHGFGIHGSHSGSHEYFLLQGSHFFGTLLPGLHDTFNKSKINLNMGYNIFFLFM